MYSEWNYTPDSGLIFRSCSVFLWFCLLLPSITKLPLRPGLRKAPHLLCIVAIYYIYSNINRWRAIKMWGSSSIKLYKMYLTMNVYPFSLFWYHFEAILVLFIYTLSTSTANNSPSIYLFISSIFEGALLYLLGISYLIFIINLTINKINVW